MLVQYTIFTDSSLLTVREFGYVQKRKGEQYYRALVSVKGSEVKQGDIVCGVRIDRVEND